MAQNPWIIRKSDGVKFRKVEKWFKLFNEENKHLMHLATFEKIQKTLQNVLKYRNLASEKETFHIASIRCVASVKPQNMLSVLDGLQMRLLKIESSQLTLDTFGIIRGIIFNNSALSEFYTDKDQVVVLKNKKKIALKEVIPVTINRICYSEDGLVISIIGKLVEHM